MDRHRHPDDRHAQTTQRRRDRGGAHRHDGDGSRQRPVLPRDSGHEPRRRSVRAHLGGQLRAVHVLLGKVANDMPPVQRGLIICVGSAIVANLVCPSFLPSATMFSIAPYSLLQGFFSLFLPVILFGIGAANLPTGRVDHPRVGRASLLHPAHLPDPRRRSRRAADRRRRRHLARRGRLAAAHAYAPAVLAPSTGARARLASRCSSDRAVAPTVHDARRQAHPRARLAADGAPGALSRRTSG